MDIRELARRSGVSVATVSRALNGRPDVSARTRAQILALAQETGYEPNQQARSLVRQHSDLVGLVWDTAYVATGARHPFLGDVLIGLKIALAGTRYHLMLISALPRGADDDQAYVRIARQYGLEGVILMSADEESSAVAALIASGRPCVGIDLQLVAPTAGYVTSDNRAGAAAAVAHLYALGHRRIATVTGPMHLLPAVERLAGYQDECARAGLPQRPEYVVHGDFFLNSGYTGMQRLLALPEPPTAVFLAGDEMAVGALHAIADAGLRVPQDVSVIGYDDVEAAALVRPALTTVAQDSMVMSAAAVDLLTQLMEAREAPANRTVLPAVAGEPQAVAPRRLPNRLVIRDSCGRPVGG
jgi:LacI family transcriptional regulator